MDWKKYEREIYNYFRETFPMTIIKFDQKISGKYSKVDRQIDILIEGNIAGFVLKIIVDCKYFSKNIDVKEVESFCSMVEDVDAHQGVLITKKGFSPAAINRAYYGNQKVELDIINFDEIKQFQGLVAFPYVDNYTVVLPAPFGWVIDIKDKINGIASLYQRGLTLKQAQKKKEWMYLEFWKLDDDRDFTIDNLIEIQNKGIQEIDASAIFEYKDGLSRIDNYQTKIRIAYVKSYPCIEVTGFIKFENFIFFAVLFTPVELLERNLRKLNYMLSVCKPATLTFDNSLLLQQSHNNTGSIPKKIPKQAREISAFFSLVMDETFEKLPIELTPTTIRCFRKGCFGIISSSMDLDNNEIHWKCSECVNSGTITGL